MGQQNSNGVRGFSESWGKHLLGGDFKLPQGEMSAVQLAELFEGWASEVRRWKDEDGPVDVDICVSMVLSPTISVSFSRALFTVLD